MTTKDESLYPSFVWQNLSTLHYDFNSPFKIRLVDDQEVFVESVFRIIPKKRLVASGIWQNKSIVAKIFFDQTRAQQHSEKDVTGIKILQSNNIPTPLLHCQSVSEDRRIFILIFEQIQEAKNLASIWEEKKHDLQQLLPVFKS